MESKRAQAAMEFLMSYGWAILVVLVVIGALAYFGVLSPQKLLPDKCTFPPGLVCEDYSVSATDGVKLVLSNGLGKTIAITGVDVVDPATGTALELCSGLTVNVNNGERTPPLQCAMGALSQDAGSKKKLNIKVTYNFGGAEPLVHTADGEVYATVQQ